MNEAELNKAESIFQALVDLSPPQRRPMLTGRCGDDGELRAFVEQMLGNHDRGLGDFLRTPPVEKLAERGEEAAEHIGRYKLLGKLGEGGFGVVYEAQQSKPVHRKVALKIIKLGMDTRQVVARFEAERQALAMMDHPNIAKVFDAGATEQGRPYFVMELARGERITDHCDRYELTTDQRLDLFLDVCDAIQHAHQKGIIHRDLKPSNVLVEAMNGRAVPKVIDFGIAKAMGVELTERTLVTEQGQLVGTPEYMSPEQADMSGANIDTRTDIYSLGVMLYELLTGTMPLDPNTLRRGSLAEIQRRIREEEPDKPSTRVGTRTRVGTEGPRDQGIKAGVDIPHARIDSSRSLDPSVPESLSAIDIARRRHTDPSTLSKLIRGDLDWITMKTLEKDRTRRYASVSELAADVRRHQRHEPVLASPPSAAYRFSKFVRRNKVAVVAGVAVSLALVLGLAAATAGFIQASKAAKEAEREAAISDAVRWFFQIDLLSTVSSGPSGREVTVREVLDAASERIDGRFPDEPLVKAGIHDTLGYTYMELGEYESAELHLAEAVRIHQTELGEEHPLTLFHMNHLAVLYARQGRYDEFERLCAQTLEARLRLQGEEKLTTLYSMNNLASAYFLQGRYRDAEQLHARTLEISRRVLPGPKERDPPLHMHNLAQDYVYMGRYDEAEPLHLEGLEGRRRALGEEHPQTLQSMYNLAGLYAKQDRYDEAEALFDQTLEILHRVLGEEHPDTLKATNGLAVLYLSQARYDEAEPLLTETLEFRRQVLGAEHPDTLASMNILGRLYVEQGHFERAESLLSETLELFRRVLREEHPQTLGCMNNLAGLYLKQGRHDEAEPLYRQTLDARRRVLGDEHPDTLDTMNNLSDLYRLMGRHDEAEPLLAITQSPLGEIGSPAEESPHSAPQITLRPRS